MIIWSSSIHGAVICTNTDITSNSSASILFVSDSRSESISIPPAWKIDYHVSRLHLYYIEFFYSGPLCILEIYLKNYHGKNCGDHLSMGDGRYQGDINRIVVGTKKEGIYRK